MNVELALKINKMVHDECKNVPHDIGMRIESLMREYGDTPRGVFLIEKLWTDSFENEVSASKGYSPFGYALTEEDAKSFCAKGRAFTQKDCWSIWDGMPEFRYSILEQLV